MGNEGYEFVGEKVMEKTKEAKKRKKKKKEGKTKKEVIVSGWSGVSSLRHRQVQRKE